MHDVQILYTITFLMLFILLAMHKHILYTAIRDDYVSQSFSLIQKKMASTIFERTHALTFHDGFSLPYDVRFSEIFSRKTCLSLLHYMFYICYTLYLYVPVWSYANHTICLPTVSACRCYIYIYIWNSQQHCPCDSICRLRVCLVRITELQRHRLVYEKYI